MTAPDRTEPLARACAADAPGTDIERWRALCLTGQLKQLLGNGRDITILVGRKTDRKRGEMSVVLAEERN